MTGGAGSYAGAVGAAFRGGSASRCLRNQCGGGGGGWYGGGAGDDGPGGGGSSFVSVLSGMNGADGDGPAAPRTDSPYYVLGVGVGGVPANAGGNGFVAIVLPSALPSQSAAETPSAAATGSRSATGSRTGSRSATATRTGSRSDSGTRTGTRSSTATRTRALHASPTASMQSSAPR